jgi:hypothetical protein
MEHIAVRVKPLKTKDLNRIAREVSRWAEEREESPASAMYN